NVTNKLLLNDSLLTVVCYLLEESKVDEKELHECLESLIRGCAAIRQLQTPAAIEAQIPSSSDQILDSLKSAWEIRLKWIRDYQMVSVEELLEKRAMRIKRSQNPKAELAVALRDTLLHVNDLFGKDVFERLKDTVREFPQVLDGSLPEHLELFY